MSDTDVFSNLRPVSLLLLFTKILKRFVFDRCVDYINTHEILKGSRAVHFVKVSL